VELAIAPVPEMVSVFPSALNVTVVEPDGHGDPCAKPVAEQKAATTNKINLVKLVLISFKI
jgi:hypothetical protein